MKEPPTHTDGESRLPVSDRIRARLQQAKRRFHANDNISAFVMPEELDELMEEVAAKLGAVLKSLVIDTDNDHNTQDTARRVAKMYLQEVFRGRYVPVPPVTEFPNDASLNELMIVGPITVRSACSHHFCPIMGRVWIGVMPNQHSNLIGLSKYVRLADWIMARPQIQEEAVTQLAELLMKRVKPDGLAVVMEADKLLHALARREGHRLQDVEQRHARFLSQGCVASPRVPVTDRSQEVRPRC